MYSSAYPLGTRLGITTFWEPASIQDFFFFHLVKQSIVFTQWLITWFYTQQIYFTAINIVDNTQKAEKYDYLFIGLHYFSVPRALWKRRKKRFSRPKRRYIKRYLVRLRQAEKFFLPLWSRWSKNSVGVRNIFSGLVLPRRSLVEYLLSYRFFNKYFLGRRRYGLVKLHAIIRKRRRRFVRRNKRFLLQYSRQCAPSEVRLQQPYHLYEPFPLTRRFFGKKFSICANSNRYLSPLGIPEKTIFRLRRRIGREFWLSGFILSQRQFRKTRPYTYFRRILLNLVAPRNHLRLLWYLKNCFDRFFQRHCLFGCANLYTQYFQASSYVRLQTKNRRQLRNFLRKASTIRFQVRRRRLALRRKGVYLPALQRPKIVYKFTYTQLALFLGLPPFWRKFVNTYTLCFLVVLTAVLKNVQVLAQWLYNIISQSRTRRLQQMRLQFFTLVAKLLRDFAVFSEYLKGFRIEVAGKTGRSQKTRLRIFGKSEGLRFYSVAFRLNYQAFDIPTFAGILGVRFWVY